MAMLPVSSMISAKPRESADHLAMRACSPFFGVVGQMKASTEKLSSFSSTGRARDFHKRTGLDVLRPALVAAIGRRLDHRLLDARAFGIGVAADDPDDLRLVFARVLAVHLELDGVAGTAIKTVAVARDLEHANLAGL